MTNGQRLKKIRKSKNLTQKQLANKVGISLMSIQRYERDERQPTVEILEKICDALDISVFELIGPNFPIDSSRPQAEKDLIRAAQYGIPFDKFWSSKTELNNRNKVELIPSIANIAELSNISISSDYTPEVTEIINPATDDEPPDVLVLSGGEFDGVIVTYNNKRFKLSTEQYYEFADRIIESVAINLLASPFYKKE